MLRRILLFIFLTIFSCGKEPQYSNPIQAKIISLAANDYEESIVTFKYLRDPRRMDGDIAQIRAKTILKLDQTSSDVLADDPETVFSKKGSAVDLDFLVKDGVLIAQNFDSLSMLSLYYDFEQIVDFWLTNFNVTLQDLGKFNIHYEPEIEGVSDNYKVSIAIRLNAAFFSGLGDFLIFKTSRKEDLPFKMNLAILAHEFGHKMFDLRFAGKDPKAYLAEDAEALKDLQGINEGFSDFCAWMLVKKTNLFADSGQLLNNRSLPVTWTSASLEVNPTQCNGGFYCKGSVLASALYELSLQEGMSPLQIGKFVFDALPEFSKDWQANKNNPNFDYFYLLNRILGQMPKSDQSKGCTVFSKWFDDDQNKDGLKSLCR